MILFGFGGTSLLANLNKNNETLEKLKSIMSSRHTPIETLGQV